MELSACSELCSIERVALSSAQGPTTGTPKASGSGPAELELAGSCSPRCSKGKRGQCLPPQTPWPRRCLCPRALEGTWITSWTGIRPGAGRGEALEWGVLPGCGQGKDKDTKHPGRAGPDKQGCILHTYINTVQGVETLMGRSSAALQRVPRWSCPWDPLWMFRPPREGGGVVPP